QEQPARLIILACSAVDTPRLALLSACSTHPNGLGNNQSGMVGENLTTHAAPTAVVQITDGVHSWDTYRDAWNTISIDDFQNLSPFGDLPGGVVFPRGGVVSAVGPSPGYPLGSGGPISLAVGIMKPPGLYAGGGNTFSPTGAWGAGLMQAMASGYGGAAYVLGVCEELPQANNRVDLDPSVRDVYGFPVARITYTSHPNDLGISEYVANRLVAVGDAMLASIGAAGSSAAAPTQELGTPCSQSRCATTAPRPVSVSIGQARRASRPDRQTLTGNGLARRDHHRAHRGVCRVGLSARVQLGGYVDARPAAGLAPRCPVRAADRPRAHAQPSSAAAHRHR